LQGASRLCGQQDRGMTSVGYVVPLNYTSPQNPNDHAGGPINFNGISAYQNSMVDSVIKDLISTLDSVA
jgi:hypothetical protein